VTGRRPSFLAWMLAGGAAFLLFLIALVTAVMIAAGDGGVAFASSRVGVVPVEGLILNASQVVEDLERFAKDPAIRAIVVRLNSPGGAVAPSQEVYSALKRIRREHPKPVWASVGIVGASGAYYIACGTDRVFASPGSIIGSIGVIAEWYNYGDLLRWAKMKDVVLKAGKLKDAGSPTREMSAEERAYLQSMVDELHAQFIAAVAEGRRLKLEQVRPLADGRVFTGQQAVKLGMIDGIADLKQVVRDAARAAGVRGDPEMVSPPRERRTLWDTVLEGVARALPAGLVESLPDGAAGAYPGKVRFQYLWR
jgi:protease-4